MEFAVLTRLTAIVLEPGNVLVWIIVIGVGSLFTPLYRAGRIVLMASAIFILFIAFLPVGSLLARPLENRYPRSSLPAHITGILVLSPGANTTVFASRGVPAPEGGDARLLAASELLHRYPDAKLIYSGGIPPLVGGSVPETVVARYIFAQMGIPPSRIIWESRARTTWENFTYSKALAKPKPDDVWIVVTSALHMPRAMGVATKLCWPVVPWPSDYVTVSSADKVNISMDFTERLEQLDPALHEWLGLIAYKLTGRFSSRPCR